MAKPQAKQKSTPAKSAPTAKKGYWIDLLYFFILLIVVISVYNKVYDKKLWLGGDNVNYYITGKAIAEGEGYTNINSPFNSPANWFPPGYPFISAIVMKIFGERIEVMNKANGFFLFGSLIFLYLISIRLTKNKHLSFVITLITALNLHILNYAIISMTEIPFIFTSLGTIYFLIRMEKQKLPFKDYNFWLFFILLIFCYYIRPTGIVLIGGIILFLLFEKKWKLACIISAGFLICAFPWYLRNKSIGGYRYTSNITLKNYYRPELGPMQTVGDWLNRFEKNTVRYASQEIPSALLGYRIDDNNAYVNPKPKDRNWLAGILFIALGIIGLIRIRMFKWLITLYMAGNFAILIIWPEVWFGVRLMLTIVPLLYLIIILALYDGVSWISKKLNLHEKIRVSFLPFIFLLFIFVLKDGITYLVNSAKGSMPPGYAQYFEIAKWAKMNIPHTSVVACRKPELFYLYSDCKTTNYLLTINADSLISNLKANKATHVVLDELGFSSTGRYLQPALLKNSEKFKLISHTQDADPKKPQTYLYEIHYECGYNGEMKDGKRNGKGISRYADGTVYDGYWKNDVREGNGIFIWPGGLKFEGLFSKNLRNGPGTLYTKKRNRLIGSWVNDTINGYAKLCDSLGNVLHQGMMKNNNFVDSKYQIW